MSYSRFALPFVVSGELLYGAYNSKNKERNIQHFLSFISSCEVLNSNLAVIEEYAAIRTSLKQAGTPIPENDIWIAAISSAYEIPLATKDKHFLSIKGIKLVYL